MTRVAALLTTGIGRKALMAVTGLALLGFLVIHLAGNLLIFSGPKPFNDYSHKLVSNPLIYVGELLLLAWFMFHFITGIRVTLANRRARPLPYAMKRPAGHTSHKSLASSTMIISGAVVLLFVPLHLLTFKFGAHYASFADPAVRDIHRLVLEVFRQPAYVVFYVASLAILGGHLWYGFESAFESLGVPYRSYLRRIGQALALLLTVGFILIPLVVYLTGGNL